MTEKSRQKRLFVVSPTAVRACVLYSLCRYIKFMRDVGRAEEVPVEEGGVTADMIRQRKEEGGVLSFL